MSTNNWLAAANWYRSQTGEHGGPWQAINKYRPEEMVTNATFVSSTIFFFTRSVRFDKTFRRAAVEAFCLGLLRI